MRASLTLTKAAKTVEELAAKSENFGYSARHSALLAYISASVVLFRVNGTAIFLASILWEPVVFLIITSFGFGFDQLSTRRFSD